MEIVTNVKDNKSRIELWILDTLFIKSLKTATTIGMCKYLQVESVSFFLSLRVSSNAKEVSFKH